MKSRKSQCLQTKLYFLGFDQNGGKKERPKEKMIPGAEQFLFHFLPVALDTFVIMK